MGAQARVKICGITSPEAAEHAALAGTDAIGVVFFRPSRRHVESLDLARDIAAAVPPFVTVVGLFVNSERDFVQRVLDTVPLGMLQFHGDESDDFCRQFQRPYLKAIRMKPEIDAAQSYQAYPGAAGILLDAYQPGVAGGTGQTFDWGRVPRTASRPIVLAGGLTAENVSRAVDQVRPWAVDVSGGVEQSPGVKDPQRVSEFIRRAKSVDLL